MDLLQQLAAREVRSVYLVTYSQADITRFTKNVFAQVVKDKFEENHVRVVHWVCCRELHRDAGYHFHLAIKLNKIKRWLSVKQCIQEEQGIVLHFSSNHRDYYSAWDYVRKYGDYVESEGHPDLLSAGLPRTTRALEARRKRRGDAHSSQGKKPKLTNLIVSDAILQNKIKTSTELLALANIQKKSGKTDLASFILNKGIKKIQELIDTTWDMENAEGKLVREKLSRMDICRGFLERGCVNDCNGAWLTTALKTLQNNNIERGDFSHAVTDLLQNGRSKYRNIMLIGPTNCGKTFMLQPLSVIFQCFQNPATSSFAWVGVESAEIIILNDLRWTPRLITWQDFLLLLEGQPIHLPAPKSHFAKDIFLQKDIPIFATSSERISLVKGGVLLQRETEMMNVRWRVFEMNHQVKQSDQIDVPPCGRCFAELIVVNNL